MCFLAAPYNQRQPSGRDESIVVHQEVREEAVVGDLGLLMVCVEAVNDRALGAFRRAFDRARARGEVRPTDDTEMIAHLAVFGVVLWGETQERAPTEEACRRILRVVLAPLAGSPSALPARADK
jgi:hypothetical protein